jgi:ABC-2 type transport system permease protein
MTAIYALWLRQLKRYVRSRSRIIGSLGQPLLYLIALGFGFGPIFQKAGQGNYIQFIAAGVIGMTVLFTSMFSGIELIWDRQFGLLKATLVAPVPRLNIMLGRTFGGATVACIQGAIVFFACLLVGFRPTRLEMLPLALVFVALIGLCFTALGTAVASMLDDFQGFQLVMNFLVMPIYFLSGALYPLGTANGVLEQIARFDPLSYGVDGLRASFGGVSHFGIAMDLGVLLLIALIFLGIGAHLFSRIRL